MADTMSESGRPAQATAGDGGSTGSSMRRGGRGPGSQGFGRGARASRLLIDSLNSASVDARTFWLFYIALMAYFLVAIASVSHEDLLLNSPVHLPFLGIDIDLDKFFRFSPVILLLVHFGVCQQHVLLSRKADSVDQMLRRWEKNAGMKRGEHPIRLNVHSYFFTQIYTGPRRHPIFEVALRFMNVTSFVVLPVGLFLYFQIAYLPYHDIEMTNLHRIYLVVDLLMIAWMRTMMRRSLAGMSQFAVLLRWIRRFLSSIGTITVILFAFFVATVPDDWGDRITRRLPPELQLPAPLPAQDVDFCAMTIGLAAPEVCVALFGEPPPTLVEEPSNRTAFFLTALFFEGEVDFARGEATSLFSRNLIVTDADLSVARTEVSERRRGGETEDEVGLDDGEIAIERVKLALRGRDLRYAVFDRSNLIGADFTASNLDGASLKGAILREADFSCAERPLRSVVGGRFEQCAKFYGADLQDVDLRFADMRGACLAGARMNASDIRGASFYKANLQGADLTFGSMQGVNFAEADLRGAKLLEADLRAASFRFAKLQNMDPFDPVAARSIWRRPPIASECQRGLPPRLRRELDPNAQTVLAKANLTLADLRLANLRGADFSSANLSGADMTLSQLQGATLSEATLHGADLSFASMHGADLAGAALDGALMLDAKLDGAVLRSATLRGADLSRARLNAADLRFADLAASALEAADLTAVDLRCARLPDGLDETGAVLGPMLDAAEASVGETSEETRDAIAAVVEQYRERRRVLRARRIDQRVLDDATVDGSMAAEVPAATFDAGAGDDEACPTDATQLSDDEGAALGRIIVEKAICVDRPNANFVATGVARRVVDSFANEMPAFQGDAGDLLDRMAGHFERSGENGDEGLAARRQGPSCVEHVDPGVVWRLTLAAQLANGEEDAAE